MNRTGTAGAGSVCFLLGNLRVGGIARNAINLADALIQDGHRVDYFLIRAEGPFLSQVPPAVGLFHGAGTARRSLPHLARYLRMQRPSALISGNPYVFLLAFLAAKLVRSQATIVSTVHTNLSRDLQPRPLQTRLLMRAAILAYGAADRVVAVSSGAADDVAKLARIPRDRIRVIYNPIVTPQLLDVAHQSVPCDIIDTLSTPVIIAAGRLTRQKDFATLIRAFAIVRRLRTDARLVILGEGEEREDLERLVRKLDLLSSVRFPGFVPNPVAYFSKADVFVLSSAWEGFGNVLAEAMAVGTPVVSTNCPSGPAEILANGKYGKLVDIADAAGLADAILSTLDSPIDPLALQDRARAFTSATATSQLLELLALHQRSRAIDH